MEDPRPLRTSPFYEREQELGAYFLEGGGWERPHWYGVNERLLGGTATRSPRRNAWAARYWHPIAGAEARATRRRRGAVRHDAAQAARGRPGPGALAFLDGLTTNRLDRPVGTVVYSLMLDERGGIRSDLTIARLGPDRFQIGANGHARPRPAGAVALRGTAASSVRDITSGTCCIGLWGPRARDVLASRDRQPTCPTRRSATSRARELWVGNVPVTALRLSYVGELGWELYTTADMGLRLWDTLWAAGQEHGLIAAGRGAFG